MSKQSDKILAEGLIKKGLLTKQAADKYLAAIQSSDESLKNYLISRNILSEGQILESVSFSLSLEHVNLKSIEIDKSILGKVPVRFAWYFKFMPIKIEGNILTLASASSLDVKSQDEIRVHLGLEPKVVLAKESDIVDAINKYYGLGADTINRLTSKSSVKSEISETKTATWVEDLEKETDDASIAKLVNEILLVAYKRRATDIHIEPYRNKVRVRYRIDGVLGDANVPESVRRFMPSIISRIKIMANLSIVEKRIPQDGSAVVKTKEQDLDLRISTIPTPHGESMVIRLLPTEVMFFSLDRLGLDYKNLRTLKELLKKSNGIILVTGPTGSGKTTTLYACLNEINSPNRKIITLEDPIEYEVEDITQIQINPKVNMGFATGLRSVLRHDPDIIMVGEVRDLETAEIAIRTALTGHLVFSTLHTNDAASGITRLIEMGLEPFLVSSSIEAFVAQRLIRVICPKCKEEVKTPLLEIREEIAHSLNIDDVNSIRIFQGVGCDYCNKTGYYGRTAIYEILTINEDIRSAILERERVDNIKRLAINNGMRTLRQDGWGKVLSGVTTSWEVLNATVKDEVWNVKENKGKVKDKIKGNSPGSHTEDIVADFVDDKEKRIVDDNILSKENDDEPRVYPRVDAKFDIRYAVLRQAADSTNEFVRDKIEHSSVMKDISAGGLRFISGYSLPAGLILDFKIYLGNEKAINCLVKVCRVEDDTLSAMYSIAVFYLDISSADRVRIENFIESKKKGSET